jgi:methyl-accepting chemotaxis protein
MKVNLRGKLLILFLVILLLNGIAGGLGIWQVAQMISGMAAMRQKSADLLVYQGLGTKISEIEASVANLLLNDPGSERFGEEQQVLQSVQEEWNQTLTGLVEEDHSRGTTTQLQAIQADSAQWFAQIDQAIQLIQAGKVEDASAMYEAGEEYLAPVEEALDSLTAETGTADTAEYNRITRSNTLAVRLLGGFLGVVALVNLVSIILVTRMIVNPLQSIVAVARELCNVTLPELSESASALATGDMSRTRAITFQAQQIQIKSNDELGELASAFNTMISRIEETASTFTRMSASLRDTFGKIAQDSADLQRASQVLAGSAQQSGTAASQIAETIQQVSQGISQETGSIAHTTLAMEQMSGSIRGVAAGAEQQAHAVTQTAGLTERIAAANQEVTASAQAQAQEAVQTAAITRTGSQTLEQTIQRMQRIQTKVDITAEKVSAMGEHSNEIGRIVETIDDIASQTNLLALNAAIEAARAGEHGKGFAVVADEVRRLAEKSAAATKEISGLVKGIQGIIGDTVKAMNESAEEVASGVKLASQSGQALHSIQAAVTGSQQSGESISAAAQRMNALTSQLSAAMNSVSTVVEQNTAAVELLSSGSFNVVQAVETIASISEMNGAAAQEVSASAEEMSAQVEEVTATAQLLSEMAIGLAQLLLQYKLR